jgi:hypothetical protein
VTSLTAGAASISSAAIDTLTASTLSFSSASGSDLNVSGALSVVGEESHVEIKGLLYAVSAVIPHLSDVDRLDVSGLMLVNGSATITDVEATRAVVGDTLSVGGHTSVGGELRCASQPDSMIDLCSQVHGSEGGPSIDATNDGATKFHIGGVLHVKIDEVGLSVFGTSQFDGPTTFEDRVTFAAPVNFTSEVHFGATPPKTVAPTYGGHNVFTINPPTDIPAELHSLVGEVVGNHWVKIPVGSRKVVLTNSYAKPTSVVATTVHDCGCSVPPCSPLHVGATPSDGQIEFLFHNEGEDCVNPFRLFFRIF